MRIQTAIVFLALVLILAGDARAQKLQLTAFGGYRWGANLTDGNYESLVGTLRFDNGPCWGFTAGYIINPRFEIELLYDRQHTSFEFQYEKVGADTTLGNGKLDYVMAGISFNLMPEDYKLMPYFTFYLGGTHIVPNNSNTDSSWYTAVGYALGVKYFFTERWGVLAVNRGASTILTSSTTLLCGSDPDQCITLPADTWLWQFELALGAVVTF